MTVRYTLALPTDHVDLPGEFLTGAAIAEMAVALEAAGVDACHVTDHPYPPAAWVAGGGHHAVDPLVALSFAAAATSRLRVHTNIYVLAYRHALLAAHGLATLDAMSGGRLILGVAVGYLEPEFRALDIEYERRGRILDETIARMKQVWTGEPDADGNVMRPTPVSSPHPPIWIGGNSAAAVRRVVAGGQGWVPFPAPAALAKAVRTAEMADLDDLGRAINGLRSAAEEAGRTEPIDICCTPFTHPHHRQRLDPEVLVEEAAAMAALGVTWLAIRLAAPSRAGYLENVERFAKEVVAVS